MQQDAIPSKKYLFNYGKDNYHDKKIINSKEYETAEKAAEESTGVTTITLSKPFTYVGKTYKKFDLEFTALTNTSYDRDYHSPS